MLQIFPAQLALCTHQSVFTLVRVQLPKSPSCSIHLKAGTLYKHLHRRLHPAKGSEAQLCWTGLSWTIQGWRSSSAVFCLGVRQQSREEKSEGGRVRQAALYHRWRQQEGPTMEVTRRLNIIIIFNTRVAEVGVLAETAKYPSMLARSARLQIFATKKHRILQLQIFAT